MESFILLCMTRQTLTTLLISPKVKLLNVTALSLPIGNNIGYNKTINFELTGFQMTDQINKTRTLFAVFIMVLLMIATRGHTNWLSSIVHLPDFTIPALFIAGIYLRQFWVAFLIIISAIAIDNYAIVYEGISANCITPAYSVLPFTYYGIFWVGKYMSSLNIDTSIVKNALIVIVATSTQWLVATSSYYFFTATYAKTGWVNFSTYAQQWSVVEIAPVLYWMIAISIVFTLNHRYSFIPYFSTQKN